MCGKMYWVLGCDWQCVKYFTERKIFSVICLCYGKIARKVFLVFGIACKNLFSENPATTVTTINLATTGYYKPNHY